MINRLKDWWKKRNEKCGLCDKGLRRYPAFGAIDVPIDIGRKKTHTVYLCNLCYWLHNK